MNCPNCGAETNEVICPVCGMNLQPNPYSSQDMGMQQNVYGAQDMNMQQGAYENQGVNMYQNFNSNMYNGQTQMGGYGEAPYGTPDMGDAYQQPYGAPYPGMSIPQKKSHTGLIVGIVVGAVAVVAVVLILVLGVFGGARKSENVVNEFMTGMAEGDTEKMIAYMDPACVDESDVDDLAYSFEMLSAMGMEYSIDYEILETQKASDSLVEDMCEGIYDDEKVADDISKAYVSQVEYTIGVTYLGVTQSQDDTIYLICYKKDGEWYLGGTVDEE